MRRFPIAMLLLLGVPLVCGGLSAAVAGIDMSGYEPAIAYLSIGMGVFAALAGSFLCFAAWLIGHENKTYIRSRRETTAMES